jgi:hypothetical protein
MIPPFVAFGNKKYTGIYTENQSRRGSAVSKTGLYAASAPPAGPLCIPGKGAVSQAVITFLTLPMVSSCLFIFKTLDKAQIWPYTPFVYKKRP